MITYHVFIDLDGTAFDETVPERLREDSVGPAQEAVEKLKAYGFPLSICTGRSAAEATYFSHVLGCNDASIAEDGAAIIYHDGGVPTLPGRRASPLGSSVVLTPESYSMSDLRATIEEASAACGISVRSCFSDIDNLVERFGFGSRDAAGRSAGRYASAWVDERSSEFYAALEQAASSRAIRVHTPEMPHLVGRGISKGTAILELVELHAIDGRTTIPIMFGNGRNDLHAFEVAMKLGGKAFCIPLPGEEVRFIMEREEIPDGVNLMSKPYGHGMLEALVDLEGWLAQRNS